MTKKKQKYKIVETENFKKQIAKLTEKKIKMIKRVMNRLAENPTGPNTMSLSGPSSPEELKKWMSKTKPDVIDLVFEYLDNKNCLNKKGKELAHDFWEKYIKEK